MHDPDTARKKFHGGKPIRRPPGTAPCRTSKGCLKGTPENPLTLSDKNYEAYRHYRESKAVGFTPDEQADPIVRRNAGLIADTEAAAERKRKRDSEHNLLEVLSIALRLK